MIKLEAKFWFCCCWQTEHEIKENIEKLDEIKDSQTKREKQIYGLYMGPKKRYFEILHCLRWESNSYKKRLGYFLNDNFLTNQNLTKIMYTA